MPRAFTRLGSNAPWLDAASHEKDFTLYFIVLLTYRY